MEKNKIRVGITHGDTNGVGYELILKTFGDPAMCDLCVPIVYGSAKVATFHRRAIGSETNFTVVSSPGAAQRGRLNMISVFDDEIKVDLGVPTEESGHAALLSLQRAVADYENGDIDVLVTAPINKKNIRTTDFPFVGHTEYLENALGEGQEALMMLMNRVLRVALVTMHRPVKDVSVSITQDAIERKIDILNESLKTDFTISIPRIAVLGLNPHNGDDGLVGEEEQTVIKPAIDTMREKGVQCFGPYSADGFFGAGQYRHFDAVLAMYHDQGLAPFKALSMDDGVNFTAGLPVVRTSPDHGTAFDIAGKGVADENSFREAVYAAIDIYRNREREDEATANPLKIVAQERDSKTYSQRNAGNQIE
jgi:4-hydroxythreonine-4-phosphate dehydrogenase